MQVDCNYRMAYCLTDNKDVRARLTRGSEPHTLHGGTVAPYGMVSAHAMVFYPRNLVLNTG